MTEVPVRHTGPAKPVWIQTRFRALVDELVRRGLPFEHALPMARALMVHLWRETGAGAHEYNWAPFNIKATGTVDPPSVPGWHGLYHVLRHSGETAQLEGATGRYRAYSDLRNGTADYLDLISSGRYRGAWEHLVRDPYDGIGWYLELVRAGYSRNDAAGLREAAEDFLSISNAVPRAVA